MTSNILELFPDTCCITDDSLKIAGVDLVGLAEQYGTPLYLYDRATMDNQVKAYQSTLDESYPGKTSITYAGKAYLCIAIAEWSQQKGLYLDCTGMGEIAVAVAAGVAPERILVHGVNKSREDLKAACMHAGVIVVDNLSELDHLMDIRKDGHRIPDLWLRFQPGMAVATHAFTQTGQLGSKFGMDASQMGQAAQLCREHGFPLKGIHFHLGSHFRNPTPLSPAIGLTTELAVNLGLDTEWTLSAGGGWAVSYNERELPQPDLAGYIAGVSEAIVREAGRHQLVLPRLNLEPGRSLVARAGVAVYRVGTVKWIAGRKWVLLDGGLADNPRPALYQAQYHVLPIRAPQRQPEELTWFAGPYCESGDVLIGSMPFPEIHEGELVAVPVSGAYQLSMSSNYNGARRPAVLWLEEGKVQLIQERETPESLYHRDHRLAK